MLALACSGTWRHTRTHAGRAFLLACGGLPRPYDLHKCHLMPHPQIAAARYTQTRLAYLYRLYATRRHPLSACRSRPPKAFCTLDRCTVFAGTACLCLGFITSEPLHQHATWTGAFTPAMLALRLCPALLQLLERKRQG